MNTHCKPEKENLSSSDCKCLGNTHCSICWSEMEDAFKAEYEKAKGTPYEDCLEAKEFMWDFFANRDSKNQ